VGRWTPSGWQAVRTLPISAASDVLLDRGLPRRGRPDRERSLSPAMPSALRRPIPRHRSRGRKPQSSTMVAAGEPSRDLKDHDQAEEVVEEGAIVDGGRREDGR